MMKNIKVFLLAALLTTGPVFAAVEVNSADQPSLDAVAGIGPSNSKAILAEREKNGNFKDWGDLERRVKGIGERNAVKLSAAGLTVNGKSFESGGNAAKSPKPVKAAEKSADKPADKAGDKAKP